LSFKNITAKAIVTTDSAEAMGVMRIASAVLGIVITAF